MIGKVKLYQRCRVPIRFLLLQNIPLLLVHEIPQVQGAIDRSHDSMHSIISLWKLTRTTQVRGSELPLGRLGELIQILL